MSDVPDELLREILLRLPVAPLLRFRSVSKSWKGLIDSDEFTRHHLNHSRTSNFNLNIVVKTRLRLYSADFDLLDEPNMATFKKLSHPLKTLSGKTEILGSCDGLLVLRNQEDNITILWNPSVKRFHVIPCTGKIIPESVYGFGYDVVSDDYKLVRIAQFYQKDDELNKEVKVYSLKSDSWRAIPDFPYYIKPFDEMTDGVLANGALHWIVTGKVKPDRLIAAFDLGTEEYRLVPLPKFTDDDDDNPILNVVVLGGCLSLMCYDPNEVHVDLWVMKEYGVQESWSLLFSYEFYDYSFLMQPLAYSKSGSKVLLLADGIALWWYDIDKDFIDVPMIQMPSQKIYDTRSCLQSLILLNNGTCDYYLVTKKKHERKDTRRKFRTRIRKPAKILLHSILYPRHG